MVRAPSGIFPAVFDSRNERLKLYGPTRVEDLTYASELINRTRDRGASKLIVYAVPGGHDGWRDLGFVFEGTIEGYFPDHVDAKIWSRFSGGERAVERDVEEHEETIRIATACAATSATLDEAFISDVAGPEDADEIASLMSRIFPDYPEPISSQWVVRSIGEETRRFRISRDGSGRIVASASAEIDHRNRSAELTDCATDPDARGRGLMRYLLQELEGDVSRLWGITDLYTLARADEVAMNCAFAKLGYHYTGRLVNNCRMPNGWESMNIWCRRGEPR